MTEATLEALKRVDQILHQAGWDETAQAEKQPLAPDELARIRHAWEQLLRPDHFVILTATLHDHLKVEEAGERLGLDQREARRLFREALGRLREFVEVCEGNAA